MKAALSAKEWDLHRLWEAGKLIGGRLPGGNSLSEMRPGNRHAVGARCLFGQEFGFTREHVHLLQCRAVEEDGPNDDDLLAIANLIEALLPPEGS